MLVGKKGRGVTQVPRMRKKILYEDHEKDLHKSCMASEGAGERKSRKEGRGGNRNERQKASAFVFEIAYALRSGGLLALVGGYGTIKVFQGSKKGEQGYPVGKKNPIGAS